jgi:hypothetical protein
VTVKSRNTPFDGLAAAAASGQEPVAATRQAAQIRSIGVDRVDVVEASALRRKENPPVAGRPGRLTPDIHSVRQPRDGSGRHVEAVEIARPVTRGNEGDRISVTRERRRVVDPAAARRERSGSHAGDVEQMELIAAVRIGVDDEFPAVRAPARYLAAPPVVRNPPFAFSIGVDDVQIPVERVAAPRAALKRDRSSVRRRDRDSVESGSREEPPLAAAVGVHHVEIDLERVS